MRDARLQCLSVLLLLVACANPGPPEPGPPLSYLCSEEAEERSPYRDPFWSGQAARATDLWDQALEACAQCPEDRDCGPVRTVEWIEGHTVTLQASSQSFFQSPESTTSSPEESP